MLCVLMSDEYRVLGFAYATVGSAEVRELSTVE